MRIRFKLAEILVSLANSLVKNNDGPQHWPYYRPVDTYMKGIGHEFACGAYSYEGLKSLVEQDGPNGFGSTATIRWLISEEGWKKVEDMEPKEIRRSLAMSGIDIDGDIEGEG